jgi:hypothetical protein
MRQIRAAIAEDHHDLQHGSTLFLQSQIVNPASIVHLSAPLALGDLVPQSGSAMSGTNCAIRLHKLISQVWITAH